MKRIKTRKKHFRISNPLGFSLFCAMVILVIGLIVGAVFLIRGGYVRQWLGCVKSELINDGTPNFGLFSWIAYNEVQGENGPAMGVMCCIGDEKLTKDLIRKNGVFSANIVTESMLPLADYYGCVSGRDVPDKMKYLPTVEPGTVLNVPTIAESPVSLELRVLREIHLVANSDLFICVICGCRMEESLTDRSVPLAQRYAAAAAVLLPGEDHYISADGRDLGAWGEPMQKLK